MLLSLGQWIVRTSVVPKGKFLKGIANNPRDLRIIAMVAACGWLALGYSFHVWDSIGSTAQQVQEQSCQFSLRQQGKLFFILPDSYSPLC